MGMRSNARAKHIKPAKSRKPVNTLSESRSMYKTQKEEGNQKKPENPPQRSQLSASPDGSKKSTAEILSNIKGSWPWRMSGA
jgi:hypothetical protein